jgi:hypothetical protein
LGLTEEKIMIVRGMILLLSIFVLGCSRSSGTVEGSVTIDGTKLSSGAVAFHTQHGETHQGWLRPDGTYRVEGVPTGPTRVTITAFTRQPDGFRLKQALPSVTEGAPMMVSERSDHKGPQLRLPPEYADPDSSQLVCIVQSNSTKYDIELTSLGAKKPRSSNERNKGGKY